MLTDANSKEKLLTYQELADYFGTSLSTVKRRAVNDRWPSIQLSQRLIRFRLSDVLAHLDRRTPAKTHHLPGLND